MWKAGRFIILYILLNVIQVHSKDPRSLKQTKLLARNENPLVVFMNPRNHFIKYYNHHESNEDREIKEPNILNNDKRTRNHNNEILVNLLANLNEYYNDGESNDDRERREPNSFNKYESEESSSNKMLDKLLVNLNNLDDGEDGEEYESDHDEQTLEETAKDQAKYLFYNFLRTSSDEDSDFEDTRQLLRQALRSRCNKVDNCAKKCQVSKPTCPFKCQKIYDEQNLCEPPKCKRPSCGRGRTMPPKWLL